MKLINLLKEIKFEKFEKYYVLYHGWEPFDLKKLIPPKSGESLEDFLNKNKIKFKLDRYKLIRHRTTGNASLDIKMIIDINDKFANKINSTEDLEKYVYERAVREIQGYFNHIFGNQIRVWRQPNSNNIRLIISTDHPSKVKAL